MRQQPGEDSRFYFVSYWVREEKWVPREALIRMHPLAWLILEKRETRNHVRLGWWQEIDELTYGKYHSEMVRVDDEFSEPTLPGIAPFARDP
jgi:hypothetical protein